MLEPPAVAPAAVEHQEAASAADVPSIISIASLRRISVAVASASIHFEFFLRGFIFVPLCVAAAAKYFCILFNYTHFFFFEFVSNLYHRKLYMHVLCILCFKIILEHFLEDMK